MAIDNSNYLANEPQRGYQRTISRRGFLTGLGALVAAATLASPAKAGEDTDYAEFCKSYIEILGKDEFERNKRYIEEEWKTADSEKKSDMLKYSRYARDYSKAFGEENFKKNRNKLVEKWFHESPERRKSAHDYLTEFSRMKVPTYDDFKKALGDRYNPKNEESIKKFWESRDDKSKKTVYLVYTKPGQVSSFYFHETEEAKVKKLGLNDKEAQDYEDIFEHFGFWKIRLNKRDFSSNLLYELFSRKELK